MKYILIMSFLCCSFVLVNAQTPPKGQPIMIDHIAISVVNLDSSVKFYQQYFALDTLQVPFANLKIKVKWFVMADGTQLHVVQGIEKPVDLPPFSHFCVRVADFDKFLETLKANNVPWHNGLGEPNKLTIRGDGVKQALIKDPSGYWIEVSNAK